ncbi:MAG TPA: dipeptidase [Blastocatellia bacterium]|nr:dipeptidase [Blastocatellia bacterium]HMY70625.1 dipeptidase [Blastocatellia bacterium]HMZ21913.1 dipeptidase [Blastocatellia bacterium]HNG34310.1 dipeptidase [Blastocatellia bacterium]
MKQVRGALLSVLLLALFGSTPFAQQEDAVTQRARKIHFSSIVLDTHIDVTPNLQREGWKFEEEHQAGAVDLPRMKKGGLNGLFFSIFMSGRVTGPKAVNDAVERIAAVHKLAADLPDKVMLCTTAADVRRAHREGKIAALMGMEGGHMINNSLPVLRMYAALGIRYLTLTHSVNTDWADSSGDQPKHNGLTPFGKDVVRELNKLGVMVDISHVADKTFWDALEVSQSPMIASHSSCRTVSGHSRNMTDEMIKALAAKGGVIQINYLDSFIDQKLFEYSQKTTAARTALMEKYGVSFGGGGGGGGQGGGQDRAAVMTKIREELAAQFGPPPTVSWEKIVEHIDHAVKLVGADHVGLGSDFDGGSMPEGMKDCTQLPKITEALLRKGYSEKDIRNILGGNTVRLLADVERAAVRLRTQKK